jgi:hypothetical protein
MRCENLVKFWEIFIKTLDFVLGFPPKYVSAHQVT